MYQEDEPLPDFVHNFEEASSIGLFAAAPPPWPPRLRDPEDPRCSGHPKVPCQFLSSQMITQKMETPVVYSYSDQPRRVNFDVLFPGGIISQSYPAPPGSTLQPPPVEPGNIYAHARHVANDRIRVGGEIEKFIFSHGSA